MPPATTRPQAAFQSSRGLEVHGSFGERGQSFVRLLLLLQGLIQQAHRVLDAELNGPLLQRAVSRDFVMLDGLRRGNHAGGERLGTLVLFHGRRALIAQALARLAALAALRSAD